MRLADDRRARVPFALLGVLLLVGSATYATTLSAGGPVRHDDGVDTAMDRAEASVGPALRSAAKEAARDAARDPVTVAADTPAGRVLDDSTPFRDALRLRIYLAAQERFERVDYRRNDVVADVSLPPVTNVSELAGAKRRVAVERTANGTAMRVTVRGVTTTARRDGRVVARDTETVTLTVSTPVLLAHDRTTAYERRLNRGPLEGRGLGQRLTGRLAPIVWARSAGQYSGMPISNVLGNRHVELAANGGVLGTQRATFGRDDPRARRGLHRATTHVGLQDLHAGSASALRGRLNRTYPPSPISLTGDGAPPRLAERGPTGPDRSNRTLSVGVDRTADVAFATLLSDRDSEPLDRTLRGSYRTTARLATDVDHVVDEERPERRPPGENWSLVDERTRDSVDVDPATPESLDVDGERFTTFGRHVTRHSRVVRLWRRGNETRRRVHRWRDEYRVSVAVGGEYDPVGAAPARSVRPTYERGGALDGPNLADVPARATDRLLETNRNTVAVRAVDGDVDDSTVVYGRRPDGLAKWVYHDLTRLRERVRNVSVDVDARAVATGRENPPARLADRLRDRRARLVDAPPTYDGVADRARVAARRAYLDRVVARLDERAAARRESTDVLDEALSEAGVGSTDRLAAAVDAGAETSEPRYRRLGTDGPAPSGDVALVPDGSPGYLTLSTVSEEHVEAVPENRRYRPLTARNLNVFAVPYGDATDGVLSLFATDQTVDLRTAGSTLVAANRTLARTDNRSLRQRRDVLRRSVGESLSAVARETRRPVVRETSLTRREHRAAVDAAFARWDGAGHRALAAANGSFARALTAEVRARADLDAREADRLGMRLRVDVGRATQGSETKVPQGEANATARVVREYADSTVKKYVADGAERLSERVGKRAARRVLNETVEGVPAGVPVAPSPGYWYATANVWHVTVRGEYLRFTVRAYSGPSDGSGATLQYVRDGSPVALDVDGDGETERLGRSERLSFETTAAAVTAVPGGRWVGDVDGNADERSAGWADGPGCVGSVASATSATAATSVPAAAADCRAD